MTLSMRVAIAVAAAGLIAVVAVISATNGSQGEVARAGAIESAPTGAPAGSAPSDPAARVVESTARIDGRGEDAASPAAAASGASPWMIRGRVVEDLGSPIGGASVYLYRDSARVVSTDASGRFAIRSDTLESDTVYAVAPGFASESGDARGDAQAHAERRDSEVTIVMTRAGSIRGRVTDEAGALLDEVNLWAIAGSGNLGPRAATSCAPDGTFEFATLPSRYHYLVVATAQGCVIGQRDAVPVGADHVDFALRPKHWLRLAVRDAADGSPVREFHVAARREDEAIEWAGSTHDDGTGSVECSEACDVLLTVSSDGYIAVTLPPIRTDGRADIGPIPIAMVRRPSVPEIVRRGIVRNARDGSIVADFAARVIAPATDAPARAEIDDGDDETGEFTCRFEGEGHCDVEVTAARFEPQRVAMTAVRSDPAAPPVEFRLEPSPPDGAFATIGGRVTIDGRLQQSMVVRLVRDERLTFSDAAGEYRIARVPPGDVTIEVGFERGCGTIATRAAHVVAGESATVDLRIETGALDVSLRDAPADSPIDAFITALEPESHELLARASWVGAARAMLSAIPAGDWIVRVDAGASGIVSRRVTVVAHVTTPVTFDLRAPGAATLAFEPFDRTRQIAVDLSLDGEFVLHHRVTTASLELQALAPGEYALSAQARDLDSDVSVDLETTRFAVRSGETTRVRVGLGRR